MALDTMALNARAARPARHLRARIRPRLLGSYTPPVSLSTKPRIAPGLRPSLSPSAARRGGAASGRVIGTPQRRRAVSVDARVVATVAWLATGCPQSNHYGNRGR